MLILRGGICENRSNSAAAHLSQQKLTVNRRAVAVILPRGIFYLQAEARTRRSNQFSRSL
jgi:hypothetical protein